VLDQIISSRRHGCPPRSEWSMSAAELQTVFETVDRVFLARPLSRYISRLVAATHGACAEASEEVRTYVSYGASPRAAIAIAEASRCRALMEGRPTVGFEDVKAVSSAVLNHRLILNYKARIDRVDTVAVIEGLLSGMDEAEMTLPAGVQIDEIER